MTPIAARSTQSSQTREFNISKGLRPEVLAQIEALPCFQGLSKERLCSIAQGKIRDKRVKIDCRITAMLVIVGNTPLTDEVFQLPPTTNERNIG